MELPSHPEAAETPSEHEPGSTVGWATVLVVAVVVAIFAVIVILHVTGIVGPAAH